MQGCFNSGRLLLPASQHEETGRRMCQVKVEPILTLVQNALSHEMIKTYVSKRNKCLVCFVVYHIIFNTYDLNYFFNVTSFFLLKHG